jgi:hypothetical protein
MFYINADMRMSLCSIDSLILAISTSLEKLRLPGKYEARVGKKSCVNRRNHRILNLMPAWAKIPFRELKLSELVDERG